MMMMIMMKEKKRKIEEKRKGRYVDNITSAIAKICKDINRKKKKEKKKDLEFDLVCTDISCIYIHIIK